MMLGKEEETWQYDKLIVTILTMSFQAAPYFARMRWIRLRCDQAKRKNDNRTALKIPIFKRTVSFVHSKHSVVAER